MHIEWPSYIEISTLCSAAFLGNPLCSGTRRVGSFSLSTHAIFPYNFEKSLCSKINCFFRKIRITTNFRGVEKEKNWQKRREPATVLTEIVQNWTLETSGATSKKKKKKGTSFDIFNLWNFCTSDSVPYPFPMSLPISFNSLFGTNFPVLRIRSSSQFGFFFFSSFFFLLLFIYNSNFPDSYLPYVFPAAYNKFPSCIFPLNLPKKRAFFFFLGRLFRKIGFCGTYFPDACNEESNFAPSYRI